MNRLLLYFALAIGLIGSLGIWLMGKGHLVLGWWLGLVVGVINFSYLLKTLKPSNEKRKLQAGFFLRYLLLAGIFFLIIQLGYDQLGSALVGFVSLYLLLLADYIVKLKKK